MLEIAITTDLEHMFCSIFTCLEKVNSNLEEVGIIGRIDLRHGVVSLDVLSALIHDTDFLLDALDFSNLNPESSQDLQS